VSCDLMLSSNMVRFLSRQGSIQARSFRPRWKRLAQPQHRGLSAGPDREIGPGGKGGL